MYVKTRNKQIDDIHLLSNVNIFLNSRLRIDQNAKEDLSTIEPMVERLSSLIDHELKQGIDINRICMGMLDYVILFFLSYTTFDGFVLSMFSLFGFFKNV